jgi:predicted transcriptional regulator
VTEPTEDTRAEDPNWQQIVCEIISSGMAQSAIAARLGVTQGAVSHIATGRTKTVEWSIGHALLALRASIKSSEEADTT